MRTYRACRRARTWKELTSALVTAENRSKMEAAFAAAIRRCGGVRGFVQEWWQQYEAAKDQAPGSLRTIRMLSAVIRLMEVAELSRPKADVSLLSDDDLDREIQEHVIRFVDDHPEIAIWAARRLGWELVPPGTLHQVE